MIVDDAEIDVIPRNVEMFDGGVHTVVTFMGSAAIDGTKYSITMGIQTQRSGSENVTHMILRKKISEVCFMISSL